MSIYYLALALFLLLLLAGGLFLQHSAQQRQMRRQRLVVALKARRNNFHDLVSGLPKGFLNQDLSNLIYRALIETCEQLVGLEPREPHHKELLKTYSSQLDTQASSSSERVRLTSPQQIRDTRHLLQELHQFIAQQAQHHQINPVQAEAYIDQIKRLVLQITVDGHLINARQAQQVGKPRLAIHHYGLARKLLASDTGAQGFAKQIAQLDAHIAKLQQEQGQSETAQPHDDRSDDPTDNNKEWDKFAEEDWRKKQLYD